MITIDLMTYEIDLSERLILKSRLLDATFAALGFSKLRNPCYMSSRQMALKLCCHGNRKTREIFKMHSRYPCVRNITWLSH